MTYHVIFYVPVVLSDLVPLTASSYHPLAVGLATLEKHGIIQSMSRKGNCLDNALAESFFGIVKTVLLYRQSFETTEEFVASLKEYIHY